MVVFPMVVNRAPFDHLLRIPGVGVTSAKRIVTTRRVSPLNFDGLKKLGVVLKRAQYFVTCSGRVADGLKITQDAVLRSLMSETALGMYRLNLPAQSEPEQLSLFGQPSFTQEDIRKCLTGQM